MRRRIVAGLAALALAFSLTACGDPKEQEQCVDPNGTRYVCEDDDSGFMPFIVPWHSPSKPKPYRPSYKAPSYKAPSYKAPSYKAPTYRSK